MHQTIGGGGGGMLGAVYPRCSWPSVGRIVWRRGSAPDAHAPPSPPSGSSSPAQTGSVAKEIQKDLTHTELAYITEAFRRRVNTLGFTGYM